MGILAFDQSTRCSGWSYFENGKYVASGIVDMTKSKLDTDERSFEMAKALWRIIKQYKPEHLILENVQQQTSPKVIIVLSRLQGMVIGYAEAHKVKTHILLPSEWRAQLQYKQGPKVKRAELKQQSADYVKNKYGFELSEDENEAIALNDAARMKLSLDDIWE
jgi:Holliday junction resolvasome RuvABC endonuclease subunit